jgi:hypothetical protein
LFFNNLDICHIESSGSQLSLFSLFSTISPLWTQFWVSVDTTWTPRWTPKSPLQRQDKVYQMTRDLVSSFPGHRAKDSFLVRLFNAAGPWSATPKSGIVACQVKKSWKGIWSLRGRSPNPARVLNAEPQGAAVAPTRSPNERPKRRSCKPNVKQGRLQASEPHSTYFRSSRLRIHRCAQSDCYNVFSVRVSMFMIQDVLGNSDEPSHLTLVLGTQLLAAARVRAIDGKLRQFGSRGQSPIAGRKPNRRIGRR